MSKKESIFSFSVSILYSIEGYFMDVFIKPREGGIKYIQFDCNK